MVAERRRWALDAVVLAVDAPLAVEELPVKAPQAPASADPQAETSTHRRCVDDEPVVACRAEGHGARSMVLEAVGARHTDAVGEQPNGTGHDTRVGD